MENGTKRDNNDEHNDLEEEIDSIAYALADFKGIGKDQVTVQPKKT